MSFQNNNKNKNRNDIRFDFEDLALDISYSKKQNMTYFKNLHVIGREYNINPSLFAKYLNNFFLEKVHWSESKQELTIHSILDKESMYEFLRNFFNEIVICQFCATLHTKFNNNFTLRYCKSCHHVEELFSSQKNEREKESNENNFYFFDQ